jgi:hypothetical protein
MSALGEHEFCDFARYCVHCGAGELHVVAGVRSFCTRAENVVAISHVVRPRLLRELVKAVLARPDRS